MKLEPPDEAEMRRRMADVRQGGLPFLVAEEAGPQDITLMSESFLHELANHEDWPVFYHLTITFA